MPNKVTLRTKKIKNNRESLYLDFYPAIIHRETGKLTRRQFIGLFIYTPIETKTRKKGNREITIQLYDQDPLENSYREKHNEDKLKLAREICVQWQHKLDRPEIYNDLERKIILEKEKGEKCFVTYFNLLKEKKEEANYETWKSAYAYLKNYTVAS